MPGVLLAVRRVADAAASHSPSGSSTFCRCGFRQIAISVADLERAQGWYRDVIGLEPAGGTNLFAGPLASMVQGVPRAASTCWWLVDRQEPVPDRAVRVPKPAGPLAAARLATLRHRLHDDLLRRRRSRPRDRACGEAGIRAAHASRSAEPGARRVCVRDPDGVLIELMEEDPPGGGPRARPRPERRRGGSLGDPLGRRTWSARARFFERVLGLAGRRTALHGPSTRSSGASRRAKRDSLALWADDMVVELVQYLEPPAGRGRPGTDLGPGAPQHRVRVPRSGEFEAAYARCTEAGPTSNGPPLRLGAWSVVYVNDDQGFSVELLHVEPWYEGRMGFRPGRRPGVAPLAGRTPGAGCGNARFRKALITGAAGRPRRPSSAGLAAEDGTALVLPIGTRPASSALAAELGRAGGRRGSRRSTSPTSTPWTRSRRSWWPSDPEIDLLIAGAGLDRAQSLLALRLAPGARRLRGQRALQPRPAGRAGAGDGGASGRPRDRDRQPRGPGRDAVRGPLQRRARRPWQRS